MRVAFCTHYPISDVFSDGASAPLPGEHPFPWVRLLARALVDGGHLSSLDILTHSSRYPKDEVIQRAGITFRIFAWQDRVELPVLRMRSTDAGCVIGSAPSAGSVSSMNNTSTSGLTSRPSSAAPKRNATIPEPASDCTRR